MQTQTPLNAGNIGWLGLELSVLRRLKFRSVALPLAGEPNLGLYLKHWNARVAANDPAQWAWTKSQAFIENNSETLTEDDLEALPARRACMAIDAAIEDHGDPIARVTQGPTM